MRILHVPNKKSNQRLQPQARADSPQGHCNEGYSCHNFELLCEYYIPITSSLFTNAERIMLGIRNANFLTVYDYAVFCAGICDPPMSARCMNTSTWKPCKPKFNCSEINKSGKMRNEDPFYIIIILRRLYNIHMLYSFTIVFTVSWFASWKRKLYHITSRSGFPMKITKYYL